MFCALIVAAAAVASPEVTLPALDAEAYFESGPFKRAQRLIVKGQTSSGVALLKRLLREHPNAPERPQARYLLGLALIRLGEYEEAARLFDELASTYPILIDDHRFFRGQALYLWKSYLDAANVLQTVSRDGPRYAEARRLRAWALLKATDFSKLVRWLEAESEKAPLEPELLFVLSRARHRTGDVLGAFRGLRAVWQTADDESLAGPALAELAKLEIGDKPLVSSREKRAIARHERALASGDDFDGVMQRLEKTLASGGRGRLIAEVVYARGRVAQRRRRVRTAEGHYARALLLAPAPATDLRARIALAQAQMIQLIGPESRALASYEKIAERFRDRPEAEAAMFRAAEIYLRTRKYALARKRCEELLLENPVSKFRRRCVWNVGWGHYRLGAYDRAREFFRSLTKMRLGADLDGASRYWLGRSHASLGEIDEARQRFREIVERYPLSYYAALAEGQLAERLEERALDASGASPALADAKLPPALVQVREYLRLGLRSRAYAAMRAFEGAKKKRFEEPVYHALARLYEEIGRSTDARRVREEGAREYPTSLGSAAFIAVARRAHPKKFEEEIEKAAEEFELPVSLLFALIRTESGFRSDAISAMDAYGLAQLILPTARAVSARIKAGRATKNRLLYDPAFNARLGAAYLRELLDRYEGSEVFALAAYNAGPNAVDAWTKRRLRRLAGVEGRGVGVMPSPDEMAEEIPVAETRAFVKAVLARARGYARLYPSAPTIIEADDVPVLAAAAYAEPEHIPARPEPIPRASSSARAVGVVFDRVGEDHRVDPPLDL